MRGCGQPERKVKIDLVKIERTMASNLVQGS